MPNIGALLRAEIRRLARKEARDATAELRKRAAELRKRIAADRRHISTLDKRLREIARRPAAATAKQAEPDRPPVRFSPAWVRKHRAKLGMSRRVYASLIGVSMQTIVGWEAGRTRPRRRALEAWKMIREKGVRELRSMAEAMAGQGKGARKRGTPARKPRARAAAPKRKRRAKAAAPKGKRRARRAAGAAKRPTRGRRPAVARRARAGRVKGARKRGATRRIVKRRRPRRTRRVRR